MNIYVQANLNEVVVFQEKGFWQQIRFKNRESP